MSLIELYQHKHYEAILGLCLDMQTELQWQELHLCALSLFHLDLTKEAGLLFEQLQQLVPATMQLSVKLLLCHSYLLSQQWSDANNLVQELTKRSEQLPLLIRISSYINWHSGQQQLAIAEMEEELNKKRKNSAALFNALGYMLVDSDADLERGYNYCHEAVRMVPNYGPYLDSFGWACFKKGELNKALYLLQQAYLLLPANTEIKEHLLAAKGK